MSARLPTMMGRSPVAPLMTASAKSFRSVVAKLFRSKAPQFRAFRHKLSEARNGKTKAKIGVIRAKGVTTNEVVIASGRPRRYHMV